MHGHPTSNDKQVTNILTSTCQCPQQREQSICEMVLHKYPEDRFAQQFGIRFSSELVLVQARVLPPPMVVASMDWPEITKYRGLVHAQPHMQKIIEDLFNVSKDPHGEEL